MLMRGELPEQLSDDGPPGVGTCFVSSIFDSYIDHAQKQGVRRRSLEVQMGIFSTSTCQGYAGERELLSAYETTYTISRR